MANNSNQSIDRDKLERMASSQAGRDLIQLLQTTKGDEIRDAMEALSAGDYEKAQETIRDFLSNPEAKKLYDQLGRE